jgi:hypothetical protein
MTTTIKTTIKIDNWDEKPSAEYDDGTKVAHAVVSLTEGNDGLSTGHLESVLYYGADGTSSYVGVLHLDGELDGRSGSFTAIGNGEYDGTTASSTMPIIGGTGELDGITGSVSSSSTQDDYPNMPLVIAYELG